MTTPAPPETPASAGSVFGDRLHLAERYAGLLADAGVVRGLLGPREIPAIWSRHLLNCAAVTELIGPSLRVVDVGSGAGLPGLVIAIRRPDLIVDLVEPLERRCTFLVEAVETLGLASQVRVVRGRADSVAVRGRVGEADVVTSRAVAALDRLVGWSLPLVRVGGRMLALKGERAEAEIAAAVAAVESAGGGAARIEMVGAGGSDARVVVVERVRSVKRAKGVRSR